MLWYILTGLAPFAWIAFYQLQNRNEYRQRKSRYRRNLETYRLAKQQGIGYMYSEPREVEPFEWRWKYDRYHSPVGGAFVSLLLAGVIAFSAGALISAWGPLHVEEHGTYPLVAMGDGSRVQAGYYLFSGYADEGQVFSYYTKEPNGSYSRGWQDARYSDIWQDAKPGEASLHQYYLVPNKWIAFEWLPHLRNEFHVPPGTIKESVTLDNNN